MLRRQEVYGPTGSAGAQTLTAGRLRINVGEHTVELDGAAVDLTAKEFELLSHFPRNPGRVFTRSQLLDSVWGYNHDGYEHTVNSHINRLRTKIERDPRRPELILTVWGVGYKFGHPSAGSGTVGAAVSPPSSSPRPRFWSACSAPSPSCSR
jgi:DNA-binding response OmpR family regulator